MPLSTAVVSGERAHDGLYLPIIERMRRGLDKTGLLFVGDCKMSALETARIGAAPSLVLVAVAVDWGDGGGHGRLDHRGGDET